MRILQINMVCGRGSTGRIATDLLTYLKETGESGRIAYGIEPAINVDKQDLIRIGTKCDYYIHNALSRISDKEGLYSHRATMQLLQRIDEYKPDILHLHNIHGHYINYKVLFSYIKKNSIPVVWTLHDCWAITGHCSCFDFAKCEQWKKHCFQCSQLRSYPTCYTKGRVKKNYEEKKANFCGVENLVVVTPSEWLADLVRLSYLSEYKVRVINNGIDLCAFQNAVKGAFRAKYNLGKKTIILGVANVWSQRKGYNDFIEFSKALTDDQQLVMVGVSEKQIEELPKSIIGIKKTDSVTELADIYSDSDVFLNFTYEDNYPTVNMEAMACGTPVVTYKTGGSVETITEHTGAVINQGDYSRALQLLPQMVTLDRNLIKQYAARFDSRVKYREYTNLYHEMLSKSSTAEGDGHE